MIRKSTFALALAAIAIGSAQASTLYIGGSSAYRKTAYDALSGNGWTVVASDASDNGGTHVLFNKGSDYISTCWSGSEAGVQSILATNSRPLTFFKTTASGGTGQTWSNVVSGDTITTNADAAFSDCSATISRWNGLKSSKEIINGVLTTNSYGKPATNIQVGVQAFTFLASEDFPTNKATSISANAARVLFEKGRIPLSLITGDSNDATATVWLTGRNPDSGTRITAFNEVGYGALKTTQNYKVTAKDTNAKTITQLTLWPTENINGLVTAPGDSGQASGGDLVKSLAPLDASLVVYGPATNKIITAVTTNNVATNIVTNSVTGVATTPADAAKIATNAPATGVYYTVKTQSTGFTKAVFNAFSYNLVTNSYTNTTVNTTLSPAAKSVLSTNYSALTISVPSTVNYLVTYASVGDALNKSLLTSNYPVLLSYNGSGVGGLTDYSTATKNAVQAKIQNGSYTFWNYEWALLSPTAQSGASTVLTTLTDLVSTRNSAPNANISSLNVRRTDGGATVYNK